MNLFRVILFISILLLSGCATLSSSKNPTLANVNGKNIGEEDLVHSLSQKERETYLAFKKQKIDRLIAQTLLEQEAQKREIALEDLLNTEVFSRSVVSHDEVHTYYTKHKFKKKKHEEWEKEIHALLQNEKQLMWTKKLIAEIARKSDIKYYFPDMTEPKKNN